MTGQAIFFIDIRLYHDKRDFTLYEIEYICVLLDSTN